MFSLLGVPLALSLSRVRGGGAFGRSTLAIGPPPTLLLLLVLLVLVLYYNQYNYTYVLYILFAILSQVKVHPSLMYLDLYV